MKRYIGSILTVLVIGVFVGYLLLNIEQFSDLRDVNILYLIVVAILHMLVFFANGLFIKVILIPFKKTISVLESFYISLISSITNYFTPMRGGAGVRAIYLKRKYNLDYADFIATLSGNYIIVFVVLSLTGLISLIYIHIDRMFYSWALYLFLILLFVVSIILILQDSSSKLVNINARNSYIQKILNIMKKIVIGWDEVTKSKKLVLRLIAITVFNYIIMLGLTFIEFRAIGVDINLASAIIYSSLSGLSLLFSITPGSIGIREAIFLVFSSVIGVTNEEILSVAVIDRGVLFFTLFVVFIFDRVLKSFDFNTGN